MSDFHDRCHAEFNFTLAPCCTHQNTKCKKHYTKVEDRLSQEEMRKIVNGLSAKNGREGKARVMEILDKGI